MKTIKEWLEELPEPYRTQAFENTAAYYLYDEDILEKKTHALNYAIAVSFVWEKTPQGHDYWYNIRKDYESK